MIKVTLAVKDGVNTLVLTPTYCEVDLDKGKASRIVWVLDDGGTDAHFQLMKGVQFDWLDKPAKGIFGDVDVDAGKRIIAIQDNHLGSGRFGNWRYGLSVKSGTEVYKLPPERSGSHEAEPGGTDRGKTPIIINR
ncbi:MAG: hypothetical protein QM719_10070 [Thermomonas sp.]